MANQKINRSQLPKLIQSGNGKVIGNNTGTVNASVTFDTPFVVTPNIIVSPAGGAATTSGVYPSNTTAYVDNMRVASFNQTNTGFQVQFSRSDGATFTNTTSAFFTWIAVEQ